MKTKHLFIICIVPLLVNAQVKTSVTNGNWNSASTWSPAGVPSGNNKVKIYHQVTLNTNFTASDTVFVYNTLNIADGKTLNLSPGAMVLVNTASYDGRLGTVGTGAAINGDFTFQKWITRCDGYSTYGFPFTTPAQTPDWYYCYQCIPSWSNIYLYNETAPGVQDSGYYDNLPNGIPRGKGFFYWYSNYNGGANFPRQISLKGGINFTSDFDFNVSYSASNGGNFNDGYNLLSNPFPGTIDWLDNAWTKNNVSSVVYTWNSCNGNYGVYIAGIGINGGSRYIPSMQGFWVRTTGNNPTLKIGSGAMVSNSQNMLRSQGSEVVERVLRLSLGEDEIAIHLDANSTCGYDSLSDALKLFTPDSRLCSTGNLWVSNDYAINSVGEGNQVIPVKVRGGGTLQISGLSSFGSEYAIAIKDLETNEYTTLTEDRGYEFTDTSTVSFQRRFQIHFVKSRNPATGIATVTPLETSVLRRDGQVEVSLQEPLPSTYSVYDLQGRLLKSGNFNQQVIFNEPGVPFVLWISNDKGSCVKKMF